MSQFEVRSVPRQETAVIHLECRPEAIAETMGAALGRVFAAVGQAGAVPAGPVFSRYFDFSAEGVDFECGVAVTTPFAAAGEVQAEGGEVHAGQLGGVEAAVGMHVGPYETLHETYSAMQAWIASQGRRPVGPMWEVYLSDPQHEPDASKWLTEVYWPVA